MLYHAPRAIFFPLVLLTGFSFTTGCGQKNAQTTAVQARPESQGRTGSIMSLSESLPGDPDQGQGPGMGGDKFEIIDDNPFELTTRSPLSTFSIDVDTASYAKVRSYLFEMAKLPRKDAVRIEELVNYFDYDYDSLTADDSHPIQAGVRLTTCPWNEQHQLARVAMKAVEIDRDRPVAKNLVFLIDVSGSMNRANKLPLLIQSLTMLTEQLDANDRISIVVYAGAAGVVLDGASGDEPRSITNALSQLKAGGSTNGGAGIMRAYALAREHYLPEGENRVILCSDGDFNVGTTGTDSLVRMVAEQADTGIFLTVLGFGMGNHNDAMMEQVSGRGNGNYFFIDTIREAEKVLVQEMSATLTTVAKDVKLQIEFNPAKVAAYRLIGYENRMLEAEDFNDDQKDAGEVGAGHRVTALYELVPSGTELPASLGPVDPLKYQQPPIVAQDQSPSEVMTVKIRYKLPNEDVSREFELVVEDQSESFEEADNDVRFAAAVASFGMLLRASPHRGTSSFEQCLAIAESARGEDPFGFRGEFCELVRIAKQLR